MIANMLQVPTNTRVVIAMQTSRFTMRSHALTSCMPLKCDDNKRDVPLNRENAALTSDVTNARINGDIIS